jgi:hypothetical protein
MRDPYRQDKQRKTICAFPADIFEHEASSTKAPNIKGSTKH